MPAKAETPFSFLHRVVQNTELHLVEEPSKRGATVLEAPVNQDGVQLYIAIDSDSFCHVHRPGNGGMRLLNYDTKNDAIGNQRCVLHSNSNLTWNDIFR